MVGIALTMADKKHQHVNGGVEHGGISDKGEDTWEDGHQHVERDAKVYPRAVRAQGEEGEVAGWLR